MLKYSLFVSLVCVSLGFLRAQDIDNPKKSAGEAETVELAQDFHAMLKTRPINYLIFPLTLGTIFNANAEIELPASNSTSLSFGIQYLKILSSAINSTDQGDFFSLRIDGKYYFPQTSGGNALQGLHLGPYIKIRASNTLQTGIGYTTGLVVFAGPLVGYQHVFKRVALGAEVGGGLGFGYSSYVPVLGIDLRSGLTLGFKV